MLGWQDTFLLPVLSPINSLECEEWTEEALTDKALLPS